MRIRKIFRPYWVEPEYMISLGYELVSDKDGYLKYQNSPGKVSSRIDIWHKDKPVERQLMSRGKRFIYINCTYAPNLKCIFVGIREDGDTRTVFNGIVENKKGLKFLLESVR